MKHVNMLKFIAGLVALNHWTNPSAHFHAETEGAFWRKYLINLLHISYCSQANLTLGPMGVAVQHGAEQPFAVLWGIMIRGFVSH